MLAALAVPHLVACDSAEGRLLVARGSADGGGAAPLNPIVRAEMALQYQITGALDTQAEADLFVVDLFDVSAAQVAALHARGRVVAAYVSVGSLENWRDDAQQFPPAAVGSELQGYPDESWLDVRSAEVRGLIEARFDRAVAKGFDAVYASTLGAYRASSGFDLTRQDELTYDHSLARAAHARGMSIGLSGDFELGGEIAGDFDWVIAIGCIARQYCAELAPFRARGAPLFDVEADDGDHEAACAQAASYGLRITFKRARYDAFRAECP